MITASLLAKELRRMADRVESGTCGVDEEELSAIINIIGNRKLNIEQICQHFNISRATLNRWQQKGKLPPFHKDSGGKDYLFQEEAETAVKLWHAQHSKD